MNRPILITGILIAAAIILWVAVFARPSNSDTPAAESEPELAESMSTMQYYTHKFVLAVEAQNMELASFYLHELEEISEVVADGIPEYDGHPIGPLVETMLLPRIETLEEEIERGGRVDFQDLIRGCNDCHIATDHGFIAIDYVPDALYLQRFQPD